MAKEKLFTSEDFDKEKPRKKNPILIWILICLAIAALVVGIIAIAKSCNNQKGEESLTKEISDHIVSTTESPVNNENSEPIEKVTTIDNQAEEQVEDEQSEPTTEVEALKEESKFQTTSTKPVLPSVNVSDNIEQEALNVIRGDYGNVPERREKLGSKYQEIQNKVNQLKKQGVF